MVRTDECNLQDRSCLRRRREAASWLEVGNLATAMHRSLIMSAVRPPSSSLDSPGESGCPHSTFRCPIGATEKRRVSESHLVAPINHVMSS